MHYPITDTFSVISTGPVVTFEFRRPARRPLRVLLAEDEVQALQAAANDPGGSLGMWTYGNDHGFEFTSIGIFCLIGLDCSRLHAGSPCAGSHLHLEALRKADLQRLGEALREAGEFRGAQGGESATPTLVRNALAPVR